MKVTIECDEWWPVYTLDKNPNGYGIKVELSQEEVEEILLTQAEFFSIFSKHQDKLESLYRKESVNATTD